MSFFLKLLWFIDTYLDPSKPVTQVCAQDFEEDLVWDCLHTSPNYGLSWQHCWMETATMSDLARALKEGGHICCVTLKSLSHWVPLTWPGPQLYMLSQWTRAGSTSVASNGDPLQVYKCMVSELVNWPARKTASSLNGHSTPTCWCSEETCTAATWFKTERWSLCTLVPN